MAIEFFTSLLILVLFTAQYLIRKKRGVAEEKPKESMLLAIILALSPVIMVAFVLTKMDDMLSYLFLVLRCIVIGLATVSLVQNFSQIKSLLQKQE